MSVPGGTLCSMVTRIGTHPLAEQVTPAQDAVWMLVDLLASIIGADDDEVAMHVAAMHSRGSVDGQCQIVADMACCDHPRTLETLDLLAIYHPDAAVAREARKCAMRLRTRAVTPY
jgi:hypothetical protein